jgi:low temperature requirement protein LtrA
VTAPAHFSERFGLVVITALDESIVAIGIGIGHLPMSWLIVATATCGLGLAAALWWMYFDVVAPVSEHRLAEARVSNARKPPRTPIPTCFSR